MPTRALITGCAGFVGSHLAEYLVEHTDWDITGMHRWNEPTDNLDVLAPMANADERFHLIWGDLNDAHSMRDVVRTIRPDYVFHLAAQSFPLTSFRAPVDTLQTNICGTVNLLEALRDYARTAWIHVCSSSEVYGQVKKENLPITEDCPFAPASPYSISKVGTDMVGQLWAQAYQMRIMVTRMFSHTGPRRGDVFMESSFAKQIAMIEVGQMDGPVRVGNLKSLRTIADVRDAVRAYHMLLTVDPQPGEVYNIGGDRTCTVGGILEDLFAIAGHNPGYVIDEQRLRPVDADLQVPDCTKFKTHTGWKPEIKLEQTLHDLLTYWRKRVKTGPCLIR